MVSVELRLFDSLDSGQGDSVEIIGGITHGFTNGFHKIRELFVSENNNENQWKPDNKLLKRLIKGLNGKKCEAALGEFLGSITRSPTTVDYPAMVNILIAHSQTHDNVIQYTAVMWLKEFVSLSGRTMLPFASGILTAVLPCLSYDEEQRRNIREAARAVNNGLMRLVRPADDCQPPASPGKDALPNGDVNGMSLTSLVTEAGDLTLDLPSVVEVLTKQLLHDSMQTRIASLRWIYHLHINTPNKIFQHVEELFPLLLKTLSDPSDEVVLLDLEVLAEISSSSAGQHYPPRSTEPLVAANPAIHNAIASSHGMNGHFTKFLLSLLRMFSTDRQLLEDRGSFIIRQLCLLLNAEDIYRCCSEILLHEEDVKFAAVMIRTLSTILLTSTELFELRSQLKDLKTIESCSLFCGLYKSWCHNPVSTVALCFLTQNYNHASDLLTLFGDLEVTVDFLTEIDKLVQLIESPIFTYLRLQLLDVEHNSLLIRSLYGLLMLLPQSDAFRTLQHRLQCIPSLQFTPPEKRGNQTDNSLLNRPTLKQVNFKELLQHFKTVQEKHRDARRQPRTMQDTGRKYSYS